MDEAIRAHVSRDMNVWLVSVDGGDGVVGQARRLADASETARGLWARSHPDVPAAVVDAARVDVLLTLPEGMAESLARAEELRARAADMNVQAASLVRQAAHELHAGGVTTADAGDILGVSQQRVSQLLREQVEEADGDAVPAG